MGRFGAWIKLNYWGARCVPAKVALEHLVRQWEWCQRHASEVRQITEELASSKARWPAGVPAQEGLIAAEVMMAQPGDQSPHDEFGRPKPNFIVEQLDAGARGAGRATASQRGAEGASRQEDAGRPRRQIVRRTKPVAVYLVEVPAGARGLTVGKRLKVELDQIIERRPVHILWAKLKCCKTAVWRCGLPRLPSPDGPQERCSPMTSSTWCWWGQSRRSGFRFLDAKVQASTDPHSLVQLATTCQGLALLRGTLDRSRLSQSSWGTGMGLACDPVVVTIEARHISIKGEVEVVVSLRRCPGGEVSTIDSITGVRRSRCGRCRACG